MVPTDLSPIQNQNVIPSPPYVPGMYGSPLFEDLDENFQIVDCDLNPPLCLESGPHAQCMSHDPSSHLDFLLRAALPL